MRSLDSIIAANRKQPKRRERAGDKVSPASGNPMACFFDQLWSRSAVRDYLADAVKPGDNVFIRED